MGSVRSSEKKVRRFKLILPHSERTNLLKSVRGTFSAVAI